MHTSARVLTICICLALVYATCKQEYQVFPGHTACLSKSAKVTESGPDTQAEKDEIVNKHNEYRANITDAKDMMKMSWDDELGMLARKWAENCDYNHEANIKRFIPGRYHVGQNLAKGSSELSWDKVVSLFYNEIKDFTYNSDSNQLSKVGHFTQLVWAQTYLVGCARAACGGFHMYVCNYAPGGNKDLKKPYKQGTPGTDCKTKDDNSLCDCGGKRCGGEGRLDTKTCTCKCSPDYLVGDTCQLNCTSYEEDLSVCGNTGHYKPSQCNEVYITFYCPTMCQVCPFAGVDYVEGSEKVKSSAGSINPTHDVILILLLVYFMCN